MKINLIKATDEGPTIAGKILLLIAIGVCSIPYGLYFGWLFYIPGLLFLWNGNLNRKVKWQWTIFSLIIWLPIMLIYIALSFLINQI